MQLKHVALIALEFLVLASLLVVFMTFYTGVSRVQSGPISANANVADTEQALKVKLDDYSKRADDLQKMISLLLGLSTIYAIVLGVAGYATLQNNLQQADKAMERLNKDLESSRQEAEKTKSKLETDVTEKIKWADSVINRLYQDARLTQQRADTATARVDAQIKGYEEIRTQYQREIPEQLARLRTETTYTRRIAIATAISQLSLDEEGKRQLIKTTIGRLRELADGSYGTDEDVVQQMCRLYVALKRYDEAEKVLTKFIAAKRLKRERSDHAVARAYYERAWVKSLRWKDANDSDKESLRLGITRDLSRAFEIDGTFREVVKRDTEFKNNLEAETWFSRLLLIT